MLNALVSLSERQVHRVTEPEKKNKQTNRNVFLDISSTVQVNLCKAENTERPKKSRRTSMRTLRYCTKHFIYVRIASNVVVGRLLLFLGRIVDFFCEIFEFFCPSLPFLITMTFPYYRWKNYMQCLDWRAENCKFVSSTISVLRNINSK